MIGIKVLKVVATERMIEITMEDILATVIVVNIEITTNITTFKIILG